MTAGKTSESYKAIESSMWVSMLSGLKSDGLKVGTLISMDDDSTCIAKARMELSIKKGL